MVLLALFIATASARVEVPPLDLRTYQVSESPKMWIIDGLLSQVLLSRVDEAFTIANKTGNYPLSILDWRTCGADLSLAELYSSVIPHEDSFVREEDYDAAQVQRGIQMTPEDSKELMATIKMFSHVEGSYQDELYVIETPRGAEDQDAHQDRFQYDLHPDYLAKTVNASLLHDMGEEGSGFVVPRVSFVINFSDVGGLLFPNAKTQKFVPAKKGRVVMFENYVNGGADVDPTAEHYGVYDERDGKRVATGGVLYNGEGPDFSSTKTSEGFVYLTKGKHHCGNLVAKTTA